MVVSRLAAGFNVFFGEVWQDKAIANTMINRKNGIFIMQVNFFGFSRT
jgi:hypothetical protein